MERLHELDEQRIKRFSSQLFGIQTVEDLFPPDNLSGDREPLRPIPPILTGGKAIDLGRLGLMLV